MELQDQAADGMKIRDVVSATVVLVLVAGMVVQSFRVSVLRRQAYAADTARTNTEARMTATVQRVVQQGEQAVQVAERRAVQQAVRLGGALETLAGLEGERATAQAQIRILGDSLRRLHQGAVTLRSAAGDSSRQDLTATDSLEAPGVRVRADVTVAGLPLPAGFQAPAATWSWALQREPITLDLSITCQPRERTARVRAQGPPWATIDLPRVEQDPQVCAPPPRAWAPFRLSVPSLPIAAVLAGGAFYLGRATKR